MAVPGLVVFDFDGTLADTLEACVAVVNRLAPEFGFRPVAPVEVEALRGLTWQELRRHFGIPLTQVPRLLARGRRLLAESGPLQPFPGLAEALRDLRARGHRLGVLTSDSAATVEAFLEAHGLELFEFVDGSTSLWGKAVKLERLMRLHRLTRRDLVYIGDETRDVEAARKAAVPSVAVTWGFNRREVLERFAPDAVVHRPGELPAGIERAARRAGGG